MRSRRTMFLPDGSIQKYREGRTKLENQPPVIHGQTHKRAYTLLHSFSLNGGAVRLRPNRCL